MQNQNVSLAFCDGTALVQLLWPPLSIARLPILVIRVWPIVLLAKQCNKLMRKTSIKSTKATKKEQRDNMIQHRTWQNGPVIVRGVLGQVAHLPCLVHPTTPLGEYYLRSIPQGMCWVPQKMAGKGTNEIDINDLEHWKTVWQSISGYYTIGSLHSLWLPSLKNGKTAE